MSARQSNPQPVVDGCCYTLDPYTALADANVRTAARRCLAAGYTLQQVADEIGVTVAELQRAIGRRRYRRARTA